MLVMMASASNGGGFLLLDVADVATLLEFSAKFKELNDELDITPVVELGEGVSMARMTAGHTLKASVPEGTPPGLFNRSRVR